MNRNKALLRGWRGIVWFGALASWVILVGAAMAQTQDGSPKKQSEEQTPSAERPAPKKPSGQNAEIQPIPNPNYRGHRGRQIKREASPDGHGPRIECPSTTIDVGTVWRGDDIVCNFALRNTGELPLQVNVGRT